MELLNDDLMAIIFSYLLNQHSSDCFYKFTSCEPILTEPLWFVCPCFGLKILSLVCKRWYYLICKYSRRILRPEKRRNPYKPFIYSLQFVKTLKTIQDATNNSNYTVAEAKN